MVKAFIRWYADSTVGRLSTNKKPTVRTTKACAERFFGGFRDFTKTEIPEVDRNEVYRVSSQLSLPDRSDTCILDAVDCQYSDERWQSRKREKAEIQL